MNQTLEIFSQGEEIVTGQTVDTNAAWLAQQATECGFSVTRHTAVGDNLDDLVVLLRDIAQRADCCVCSGGLGPTSDDLTAEAVAKAFNLPLVFDDIAFQHITRFFANRNRAIPASNRKQAMLPQGAERIDNEWGTAPGFSLYYGRCWFVFLPGVPMEMKHLFEERILPTMASRFKLQPCQLITFKTLGLGESAIQERVNPIEMPAKVRLGFRAGADDVQIKLLFPFGFPKASMSELIEKFAERLGDYVFAIDGLGKNSGDLVFEIDKLMMTEKHTLAVVETASQGMLAAKCMGSEWLLSAIFEKSISKFGQEQISENTTENLMSSAKAIALDRQQSSGADIVIVQLYSGDKKIMHDKDGSIVLSNTLLTEGDFYHSSHLITGPIKRKQNQSALMTLDLLRRYLQGKTINY